jgi:hypothetical protein
VGLYFAYGITIESEIPLPELPVGFGKPELTVRRSGVKIPPEMPRADRKGWAGNGTVWLFCRRRGTLQIDRGREIVVDAAPGADERIVRNWVTGPGLGVAMFQRGLLVLHASVVESAGSGVAFLGASGAGKSTMAMAFCRSGDLMLADDHAVVAAEESPALVLSGFPQIRLREDVLSCLERAEEPVGRAPVSEDKLGWNAWRRFAWRAAPLRRAYVLAEDAQVSITPLPLSEATVELVQHSFLSSLLIKPDLMSRHKERCAALAAKVPVSRLARPRELAGLPDLMRRLQEQNDESELWEPAATLTA